MRTTSPDGTDWRVGRVWWRGRPRWRKRDKDDALDGLDGLDLDDFLIGLVVAAVLVLVLFLLLVTVIPAVLFLAELALVLLLALGGLLGRVVLRRPWTVRATGSDGRVLERQAVGWRASGRARDELAAALQRGTADR